jgi:hypothetical protein
MRMDTSEFDLDRYLRASNRVDLSTVEWDRVGKHPVANDEARCLTYMMDIETHTVVFLRDLLATRASFDPEVTAFLSCWVYEELWHGEAFSRFLGEAGYRVPPSYERVEGDDPFPTRFDRNQWIRQKFGTKGYVSHMGTLLGSALFRNFVAVHMTWGAVNELSTLTAYHRIIAKTEHPVLIQLLQAIDHQGRAAALRVLSGASEDAPRTVETGAHDHPLGARASLGSRGNGCETPAGDRLRDPLLVRRRRRAGRRQGDGAHARGAAGARGEHLPLRRARRGRSAPRQAARRRLTTLRLLAALVPRTDPGALRSVHDLEAHRLELVAELVGSRVVLRRSCPVPFGHEPLDPLGRLPTGPRLPL